MTVLDQIQPDQAAAERFTAAATSYSVFAGEENTAYHFRFSWMSGVDMMSPVHLSIDASRREFDVPFLGVTAAFNEFHPDYKDLYEGALGFGNGELSAHSAFEALARRQIPEQHHALWGSVVMGIALEQIDPAKHIDQLWESALRFSQIAR